MGGPTLDRRRALRSLTGGALAAGALLAGCGFSPALAPGQAASRLRGRILADAPGNREAFVFVGRFEDRLGRAAPGDLRLSYTLDLRQERLALSGSGGALRLAIVGSASFQVRRASGEVLTRGEVTGSASYSDSGGIIAVRTARADARRRTAAALADRVADRLIATAAEWLP